jgi:hypothetical protein
MGRADDYRKRADAVGKSMRIRNAHERSPMLKKKKALTDMADNEEWLDGKIKTKRKPKPKANA